MKKLLIGLTLLASMSSFGSELSCYSEVIKTSCSRSSQDPLAGASTQYWVSCEGYIIGQNPNGEREAVSLYRQQHYYPEQNSIKRYFQVQGIAKSLKGSIKVEVGDLKKSLDMCSK
jgi:hypothetical protein